MQTVASLAERLDMSAEEAIEKLRYMLFEVDDVNTKISDEECDLLFDVDDDLSVADEYREKRLSEVEKQNKAAAKKKAAQSPTIEAGAATKGSPITEMIVIVPTMIKMITSNRGPMGMSRSVRSTSS